MCSFKKLFHKYHFKYVKYIKALGDWQEWVTESGILKFQIIFSKANCRFNQCVNRVRYCSQFNFFLFFVFVFLFFVCFFVFLAMAVLMTYRIRVYRQQCLAIAITCSEKLSDWLHPQKKKHFVFHVTSGFLSVTLIPINIVRLSNE